jgi:hypothetical protein
MKLDYDLVPYSEEIQRAYVELLPEQEQDVARGKLEWKFRHQPSGTGAISVARDQGGRILGLNGFMSGAFKVGGERERGFQSMDTIVSPEARGQGVFGKLLNCFYDRSEGALLYGFPNLNSSPAFFGKLGWSHFGPVPMLIRPLRTGFFLKRVAGFLPDLPLPNLAPRLKSAEEIERFDASATEAWRRFSAGIGCAVERDSEYLNWRIADHPSERYTILRSSDGAFAVGNLSDKHGARIGYLMEAVGEAPSLAPLIGECVHRMRSGGAEFVLAWCEPWSPNYRAFRKAGFLPLPTRLRPIVINFGARPVRSANPAITEPRSWYVSYLDSDTA